MTRPHPWLEKKTHLHPSWASLFLFVCPSLLISFFLTCSNVAFFVCSILEAVKRADWCFVKSTDIHWAVRVTDGGFRAKARCRHSWRANPSVAVLHVANVNPPYDFITLCVHSLSLSLAFFLLAAVVIAISLQQQRGWMLHHPSP